MSAHIKTWQERMQDRFGSDLMRGLGKTAEVVSGTYKDAEIAELRAALQSRQGVAVPAGWQLVPVVATDDMWIAFCASYHGKKDGTDWDDCWKALLAAAPQPPAVKEAAPRSLFDRKLADLQQRGYEVIGRILHKNGQYALFDSSCRWLTRPQYMRLMHEQDGSLFAPPLGQTLREQYEHEHPAHLLMHWSDEVNAGDTLLGYWEWVAHKLEES
jgi:hypothetical protein